MNPISAEEQAHSNLEESSSDEERGVKISSSAGCLLTFFLGLLVALVLMQLFQFIIQGEKFISSGDFEETRIWIVRQTDADGLGFSRSRVVSTEVGGGQICVQTDIGFLLWKSDRSEPSVSYCECLQRTGSEWQNIGTCEEVD